MKKKFTHVFSEIKAIYDAGENNSDRYAIYLRKNFAGEERNGEFICLVLGETEDFGHASGSLGKHNGRRISFHELSNSAQMHLFNYFRAAAKESVEQHGQKTKKETR